MFKLDCGHAAEKHLLMDVAHAWICSWPDVTSNWICMNAGFSKLGDFQSLMQCMLNLNGIHDIHMHGVRVTSENH